MSTTSYQPLASTGSFNPNHGTAQGHAELGAGEQHGHRSLNDRPSCGRSFTYRAVIAGLLLGILINISNTYYGLRLGAGSQMSMVSGLLGFAGFKSISRLLAVQLTPEENVLLISVATSTGLMTLTSGLIGVIPALEYLISPNENGPVRRDYGSLVLWSVGLCFFGIIFTALLRGHFIGRERLPWPGPRATAHLIRTLHHIPPKTAATEPDTTSLYPTEDRGTEYDQCLLPAEPRIAVEERDEADWRGAVKSLARGTIASGIISILLNLFPIAHNLPVFGHEAASKWLWTLDLSPGFFGQGMIMGPFVSVHMLFGALIGWGVLSPYAKYRGWAPGDVDDWETGSRGWIIWVSLASLITDALVKLVWVVLQYSSQSDPHKNRLLAELRSIWMGVTNNDRSSSRITYTSLPSDHIIDADTPRNSTGIDEEPPTTDSPNFAQRMQKSPPRQLITLATLGIGFILSLAFCTFTVHAVFGTYVPWYFTPLAVFLSLPMAAVGIRSIAETDYNPESAIISQLVFAAIIAHSDHNAVIINLLSAAIAVAGANQAGDLAYDLKVGNIIGAHPEAQVRGQIIGSLFGSLISCGIYKLYASQYPIPGPLFKVPSAYLVLSTTRLLLGRGLPEGVLPFVITAAILSALATVVKTKYEHEWWQKLIPSGVSFAMGIYLLPSFSITRALGGLFCFVYAWRNKGTQSNAVVPASGLVLGESLASLVTVILTVMDATGL